MIKIASFNVENLFARPKAFSETDLSVAQPILKACADIAVLIALLCVVGLLAFGGPEEGLPNTY